MILVGKHLQSFFKYMPLLFLLTAKDFKLKYRRSVLGIFWSMLNPLLLMIVFTSVFTILLRSQPVGMPFAVFYVTGALVFNLFNEATTNAMTSVISNALLIQKVYIPKYIFPIEKCAFSFVNTIFSIFAVFLVLLYYFFKGEVHFHLTVFFVFLPILFVFLFAVGVSLILSSVAVFFRDIIHIWGVLTTILFYLTPLIYPIGILENYGIGTVVKLNPLYYFVDDFRKLLVLGQIPSLMHFVINLTVCFCTIILGLFIFKKTQDKFIFRV